ncbi:hypothetical protein K1F50_08955 [Muricauda oceani]|nr:hypothetical protein [Allomuricauda oceani]MBW8242926.1 hypothetical protein [Allomuricauda oceani]
MIKFTVSKPSIHRIRDLSMKIIKTLPPLGDDLGQHPHLISWPTSLEYVGIPNTPTIAEATISRDQRFTLIQQVRTIANQLMIWW